MFQTGQELYRSISPGNYKTHTIDNVANVVDADGKEMKLYHMTGYGVWFTEERILNDFLFLQDRAAQLCVETESGGAQIDHQEDEPATEIENGK